MNESLRCFYLQLLEIFKQIVPSLWSAGLNADILVDRPHQFYWCKVPKAASTSWISLLLSDRQFANLQTSIGRQHMYLR